VSSSSISFCLRNKNEVKTKTKISCKQEMITAADLEGVFLTHRVFVYVAVVSGSQHTYKELLLDALDYYTKSKQCVLVRPTQ